MSKDDFYVTEGNVFEDLGLEDSAELTARSDLLSEINQLIRNSGIPQKEIAKILHITPSKVSMLMTGKLSAFSADSLMRYLTLLGCSVEIKVQSRPIVNRPIRRGNMVVRRNRPRKARKKRVSAVKR